MDDAKKRGQRARQHAESGNRSSSTPTRGRALRNIAWAQMKRHRRLSQLSVQERRRALAKWLRGMQP